MSLAFVLWLEQARQPPLYAFAYKDFCPKQKSSKFNFIKFCGGWLFRAKPGKHNKNLQNRQTL